MRLLKPSMLSVTAMVIGALTAGVLTATPAMASTAVTIPDADFARCIAAELKMPATTRSFTSSALAGVKNAWCNEDSAGKTYNITSIEGAQYLTALEGLDLEFSRIADFGPLSGSTHLTVVVLNSAHLTSLSSLATALAGNTGLTELSLDQNQISDIGPLAGLTRLDDLHLWNNRIADLSPLAGLNYLRSLDLTENGITSLSTLHGLTNLSSISLGRNKISDVTPLAGLTNLVNISLRDGNTVTDPRPLTALPRLSTLDLGGNGISDLSPFADFAGTNLTQLWLGGNKISNLEPLSGLTGLTSLILADNQVSDLRPIAGLHQLTQLWMGVNLITDVNPLSGLTKLYDLDVSSNPLSDVSPLAKLPSLGPLMLSNDQISDISPLASLAFRVDSYNIIAESQAVRLTAPVGASVPLRGWKGKLPSLGSVPRGLLVIDGKLVATVPGTHKVSFRAWGKDITQTWFGTATVTVTSTATVSATSKVTLSSKVKSHSKKGRATIRIIAGKARATGKVMIVDGTKLVKTAKLSASGTGSVTLPKLRKGSHLLTFFYPGTDAIKSVVKTVKLKVK